MRIGIDARALTGRFTGDRTYWLNLLRELTASDGPGRENEYILYSRLPIPSDALPPTPGFTARAIPANNDRIWTMLTLPRALKQDGIDLAHTQYTTPLHSPCPVVTTVHDISFRLFPEWFPRKHRLLLNLTVPRAMRKAAAVITDSESSRRDILRIYGLPDQNVRAIALAAGPEYTPMDPTEAADFVKAKFAIRDPFCLAVGVLQPRKNLPLLMEAFARFNRANAAGHKLVITGKRGWAVEDLDRHAARLGITKDLIFTDYVADSDLPALYSACETMAYPSLYEGFGLPPLEAMACGAAVLVSDAPCMPEVAGDGAWILPVMDPCAWADALARLASDPVCRNSWAVRGINRAAQFSWRRTAAETVTVYHAAVAKGTQASPAMRKTL